MTHPPLPPFYRLVARDRVASTNEEARRLAEAGAGEGTLVWAKEQNAGRGRRGRTWSSPPGNLYASLLLRPRCAPSTAAQLGFVTGLALALAIEPMLPPAARPAELKWPNDLLLRGKKAAGILLEASAAADRRLDWLIVGVGVNVLSFPSDTPYAATSLRAEGASGDAAQVLAAFAHWFHRWHERWRRQGFAPVRRAWSQRARGLGAPIVVRLEEETLEGRFADLDDGGCLTLELAGGGRRRVSAGDVFYPGV